MPLQLRPATDADGFALGCIGQNAFRDIFGAFIFPPHLHSKSESGDPELDEVHWRATRTLRRMKEGKPTFVAVDVSEDGAETVVGYAQWESPSSSQPPTSELSDVCELTKDPLPPCLDEGNMLEIYRIMETETRRALGPEGHSNMWYLMLLAVEPSYHRRGIGKMLLQHGLDLVVRDEKDAFLIATPGGRGLYQKMGFRQVGEEYTLGGTPHYSMLWQRPAAGSL